MNVAASGARFGFDRARFVGIVLLVLTAKTTAARPEETTTLDCGVNALYVLMRLEGRSVTFEQVEDALPRRDPRGYSIAELARAARRLGLPLEGVRFEAGDAPLDRPALAFFQDAGTGHFAVLRPLGTTGTMVQVIDPPFVPRISARAGLFARARPALESRPVPPAVLAEPPMSLVESEHARPTPAALGYRLPAEWEPHAATWLAWPQRRADWPGKFAPIPWVHAEIVRHLARVEPVNILVADRAARRRVEVILSDAGVDLGAGRVRFVRAPTDRSWLRDTLPSFVVRHINGLPLAAPMPVAVVDWRFNGWAKYPQHRRDARLPRRLAKRLELRRFKPRVERNGKLRRVVLEGGAIDVNGRGTLLTTEECLLSEDIQARNPGLDREGYERVFAETLGATQTIWLGRGIAGDDTHGHVDDIARFVDPTTVVAAVEPNPDDPNHAPLRENLERLRAAADQDGQSLRVVELPMPAPVTFGGDRLPASYANFYIANGLVLVPTFNDPNDRHALNVLAEVFPDRAVVGIHSRDLVLGLGALHCLAHEQPSEPEHADDGASAD